MSDRVNTVLLSAASAYEIEFKRTRDPVLMRLPPDIEMAGAVMGFAWLAITPGHAATAGRLPRLHGDPFDRILLAQVLSETTALVSVDSRLPAYGAPIFW